MIRKCNLTGNVCVAILKHGLVTIYSTLSVHACLHHTVSACLLTAPCQCMPAYSTLSLHACLQHPVSACLLTAPCQRMPAYSILSVHAWLQHPVSACLLTAPCQCMPDYSTLSVHACLQHPVSACLFTAPRQCMPVYSTLSVHACFSCTLGDNKVLGYKGGTVKFFTMPDPSLFDNGLIQPSLQPWLSNSLWEVDLLNVLPGNGALPHQVCMQMV